MTNHKFFVFLTGMQLLHTRCSWRKYLFILHYIRLCPFSGQRVGSNWKPFECVLYFNFILLKLKIKYVKKQTKCNILHFAKQTNFYSKCVALCAYTFIFYIKWKDFSLCWLRPQKSQALDVRHLLIYFITIIIKLRQKHKDELV